MGSRPNAVLWYGTKAVDTCPINPEQEYDDETDEVKPGAEPMEYEEQEAFEKRLKTLGVELVEFHGEGDPKYALALKGHIHNTDWDGDLALGNALMPTPLPNPIFMHAMKEVGWPYDDDDDHVKLEWRLGAYYW